MLESLLGSSYFALFLIVALGFVLGSIRIKGISLDISAVIFIALLFGHYGVVIPAPLSDFGMVLFIFTIGIQAGPGFFDSFRSKGKSLAALALLIVGSATAAAVGMKFLFGLNTADTTGLLTGALTSTPGLAAAKELSGNGTAVAYGIAYPFGVIGVILFVKLLPRLLKADPAKTEKRLEKERMAQYPGIGTIVLRVTNANVFGKSLEALRVRSMTGAVVSRIQHDGKSLNPHARAVLHKGDYIKGVGTPEALGKLRVLIGEEVPEDLPLGDHLELQTGLVTNKRLVNARLGTLNIQDNFRCTVTRVRRSGIDISPQPDLQLKFGDKLTLVGARRDLEEVMKLIGNDNNKLSDTDFFPIAAGIVLGVLFGKLSLSFGPHFSFSFGLTGGILLVALVLSAVGRTGPVIWTMSSPANQLLRQVGLLLFLAGVGTSAGTTLVQTFTSNGLELFLAGAVITLTPLAVSAFFGYYVLKIDILDLLGAITGGMTSTPGLAAADSMTRSGAPSIAYATVYPVAMVFLILCVQLVAAAF